MPFDDPRELANGFVAASRAPSREQPPVTVHYGPFGERYESVPYEPPTIMGHDPMALLARFAYRGGPVAPLAEFMRNRAFGRELPNARTAVNRGDDVNDILAAHPELARRFRDTLGPGDRLMELMTRRPSGWPLWAAPGHIAAQASWLGGTTYLADRMGIWDPIKDVFRQSPPNRGVDVLDGQPY